MQKFYVLGKQKFIINFGHRVKNLVSSSLSTIHSKYLTARCLWVMFTSFIDRSF